MDFTDEILPLEHELLTSPSVMPVMSVTPLLFNDEMDTTGMKHVLLIDSVVAHKQLFYDNVNAFTFPIIYSNSSSTDDLLSLLRQKFPNSTIERISLAFHGKETDFMAAFMDHKLLFEESDLTEDQTSFTDNVTFLADCIKEFKVANIDFLACNTLQYSNWNKYYALLASQTSVIVGASNDKTGNLNYGGDWVMENTNENVRDIYFNENISNYASTLVSTTITPNPGAVIYLRMDPNLSGEIQFYISYNNWWTNIASGNWPVEFVNSDASSILNVIVTQDLTITNSYGGTSGYFITGSQYVTFDGAGYAVNINGVTSYPGFIRNGTSSVNGFANVVVKNFTMNAISGSTLANSAGWLCQSYFGSGSLGNSITNCTNNGLISGQYTGGICGQYAGNQGSVTFTSCTNTGDITISGFASGGICGQYAGYDNGSATLSSCTNTGPISGDYAGGICGPSAAYNGLATLTKCFSTGSVTGQYAGGICGSYFAYNTNQTCSITNCYSTGQISGQNAGGITGANVGFNNVSSTGVNITSCYSLGAIASTCGGICGGLDSASIYTVKPNINISNTYSYGTIVDASSGLVAVSLTSTQITLTATNTYVANNNWTDATANSSLTGTPNSPGITWSSIVTGDPYVLSAYDAHIYSPNSTSSASNYTSSQGLFQPGFTYDIVYSNQVGATLTLYVAAYKGTSPDFTEYNINTFTITNTTGSTEPIPSSINPSNGVLSFTINYPCFLEDTKILCLENNVGVYRKIQDLRKGDLVKTIYNQYVPICMIGTTTLYNPGNNERTLNRLYKCSRENYPTLSEDLYITGCHSILVPFITYQQEDDTAAILGDLFFVTDNHCRLMACVDEKAEPYNKAGFMNIYHVALEHHDEYMNYGIYANGLLVESCSIDCLKYSNMRMLGEEETSMECASHQAMTNLIKTC